VSTTASSALTRASSLELRSIRFEEVGSVLDLIHRAIEHGCRDHYTPAQRRAVYLAYAGWMFAEVPGPFESIVTERGDTQVGYAQFDPAEGWLRALFVDGEVQHRGIGSMLLAEIERRARQRGTARLCGAMSLNAVPFYVVAGFRPLGGPERLTSAGVWVPVVRMAKLLRS
jgi:GNAT superfamily N-acetyltransferase